MSAYQTQESSTQLAKPNAPAEPANFSLCPIPRKYAFTQRSTKRGPRELVFFRLQPHLEYIVVDRQFQSQIHLHSRGHRTFSTQLKEQKSLDKKQLILTIEISFFILFRHRRPAIGSIRTDDEAGVSSTDQGGGKRRDISAKPKSATRWPRQTTMLPPPPEQP
jgi:hypothetical protein